MHISVLVYENVHIKQYACIYIYENICNIYVCMLMCMHIYVHCTYIYVQQNWLPLSHAYNDYMRTYKQTHVQTEHVAPVCISTKTPTAVDGFQQVTVARMEEQKELAFLTNATEGGTSLQESNEDFGWYQQLRKQQQTTSKQCVGQIGPS